MDKILEKTAPGGAAWFVVLTSYYQSDQVEGNVMGAPCGTYGGGKYIYGVLLWRSEGMST